MEIFIVLAEFMILYRNQIGLMISGWGGWYVITHYESEIHQAFNIFVYTILFSAMVFVLLLLNGSYQRRKQEKIDKYKKLLLNTDFENESIFTIISRFMRFTSEPLRAMTFVMEKKGKVNKFILEGKFRKFTPMNASKIITEFRRINYA